MRLLEAGLTIASLALSGCTGRLQSEPQAAKWTYGFWFWQGSSPSAVVSKEPVDVLYVHAGTIEAYKPYVPAGAKDPGEIWRANGKWPDRVPAALEYWLVFRFERQSVPELIAAPVLALQISQLVADLQRRRIQVTGVQLDIDSPTVWLKSYANLLREFRKGLPKNCEISITALLDWFRDDTDIGDVIQQVDEFVPQFYDVAQYPSEDGVGAVAAKIDASRWGPVFNRFGKRFRIGISTFGRARLLATQGSGRKPYFLSPQFSDLTPLDIATHPAFQLAQERRETKELVLNYRATRETKIEYRDYQPGDTIQFTLATPESIQIAVGEAKRMGGHAAGVIFFRWPAANEQLAMNPDDVLRAAGVAVSESRANETILLSDGGCAAVNCVDVFLDIARPNSPSAVKYRVRSSAPLDYFLPEQNIPVRMVAPSELEVSLPPYGARGRLYLGRAVSAGPAKFTVEDEP